MDSDTSAADLSKYGNDPRQGKLFIYFLNIYLFHKSGRQQAQEKKALVDWKLIMDMQGIWFQSITDYTCSSFSNLPSFFCWKIYQWIGWKKVRWGYLYGEWLGSNCHLRTTHDHCFYGGITFKVVEPGCRRRKADKNTKLRRQAPDGTINSFILIPT